MTRTAPLALLLATLAGCATPAPPPTAHAPATRPTPPTTIVLIHGAYGGGWAFRDVADRLAALGFRVYRPTLTGQGERVHLATPDVSLDTHVADVANLIRFEDLHDVVLVAHSYGGMVATAVVDQLPDRIARVVYLDAFLPLDGETASDEAARLQHRLGPTRPDATGYLRPTGPAAARPIPHDVPQPGRTFSQPIRLAHPPAATTKPTTYVLYTLPGQPPADAKFAYFYRRAQSFGWPTLTLTSDHNAHWSHPADLARLLAALARP